MKLPSCLVAGFVSLAMLPFCSYAVTQQESDEIDAFLSAYSRNIGIVKRLDNAATNDISCVDVNRQPAMNHPLAHGTVQMEPSPQLKALLDGPVVPAAASQICPPGSVEMRLPTREQIMSRGSLKNFLSKYPDGKGEAPRPPDRSASPSLVNGSGHLHAVTGANVLATAARTTINVWQPNATGGDFSLSQLWVLGGTGASTQTVEAGWNVFPSLYQNDARPHFFIYYTADNYGNTGCYNLTCTGGSGEWALALALAE